MKNEKPFLTDVAELRKRARATLNAGADEYVQQLVENYVDHNVWFRQKVTAGLAQLDRGEFLSREEVGSRLQKMFQP